MVYEPQPVFKWRSVHTRRSTSIRTCGRRPKFVRVSHAHSRARAVSYRRRAPTTFTFQIQSARRAEATFTNGISLQANTRVLTTRRERLNVEGGNHRTTLFVIWSTRPAISQPKTFGEETTIERIVEKMLLFFRVKRAWKPDSNCLFIPQPETTRQRTDPHSNTRSSQWARPNPELSRSVTRDSSFSIKLKIKKKENKLHSSKFQKKTKFKLKFLAQPKCAQMSKTPQLLRGARGGGL